MFWFGVILLVGSGGLKFSLWLYPLLLRAVSYSGAVSSKLVLLDEMVNKHLFMLSGMFLTIEEGWLLSLYTYGAIVQFHVWFVNTSAKVYCNV